MVSGRKRVAPARDTPQTGAPRYSTFTSAEATVKKEEKSAGPAVRQRGDLS